MPQSAIPNGDQSPCFKLVSTNLDRKSNVAFVMRNNRNYRVHGLSLLISYFFCICEGCSVFFDFYDLACTLLIKTSIAEFFYMQTEKTKIENKVE